MDTELTEAKLFELNDLAVKARELLIETLVTAGSGHSAGPLGMADIFVALYFRILKHDPKNPDWEDRDKLVLSNGHICPIRYVVMAMAGYFPIEELKTLRKINSRLQGHPSRHYLPGLETSSGPLGEGISQAIGMAIAAKLNKNKQYIYCITSDGEHQEGNTWEAIMFAGKNKINNLTVIVDRNNIQIDGFTEDIMPLEPFKDKYESFGWYVLEVDGNNIRAFEETVREARAIFNKPTVIIAHTIPGKGVDFMERNYLWHGNPPDVTDVPGSPPKGDQAKVAMTELRTLQGKIESEHQ